MTHLKKQQGGSKAWNRSHKLDLLFSPVLMTQPSLNHTTVLRWEADTKLRARQA